MSKIKGIKDKLILSKMKNKKVLQIGVLGDFNRYKTEINLWEFKRINDISKKAIGIDIHKKYVNEVQQMGF